MKLEKFNIADFHYLKHNLSVDDDGNYINWYVKDWNWMKYSFLELENARKNPYRNLKSVAVETRSALEKLYASYKDEVSIIWNYNMLNF